MWQYLFPVAPGLQLTEDICLHVVDSVNATSSRIAVQGIGRVLFGWIGRVLFGWSGRGPKTGTAHTPSSISVLFSFSSTRPVSGGTVFLINQYAHKWNMAQALPSRDGLSVSAVDWLKTQRSERSFSIALA